MPYLPHGNDDVKQMLKKIGVDRFEDLLKNIPEVLKGNVSLNLPGALSELEIRQEMHTLLTRNTACHQTVSFLGAGAYDHFIPSVVDFITSRPEFSTAYTPYQAEVSQGTLQAMYEFQSLICELTGMDVSNASMYDAATSMTEAILMAKNVKRKKNDVILSSAIHPLYRMTLETYARSWDLNIIDCSLKNDRTDLAELEKLITENTAAVVIQSPNFFGCIEDTASFSKTAHAHDALFIQGVDPISLAILKTPGDVDADIAFGEGQSLGIHLNFGGPYLGLFTAKQEYVRKMPGRIAGMTEDTDGNRGYVLTLQTREQHIRREKATSNICSNEALCALAATVYLALMGRSGLKQVAELCVQKAHYLQEKICELSGYSAVNTSPFFKEFVIETPLPAKEIIQMALDRSIYAGIDLGTYFPKRKNQLLIAVTEKRTKEELDKFLQFLKEVTGN
ncbi:MAG: aminomethyl-transferring glycine dehydrogenase subunit GcvPA [Candidatus Marinimicrobia bacterium]|nr:aminomethyl-transferring glycine dehydrogenase subunit GcvPA [Candidatus Neomarinimicrobiota bacterium]